MKIRRASYWVTCPALYDEGDHTCRRFCTICANAGVVQAPLAVRYIAKNWSTWVAARWN